MIKSNFISHFINTMLFTLLYVVLYHFGQCSGECVDMIRVDHLENTRITTDLCVLYIPGNSQEFFRETSYTSRTSCWIQWCKMSDSWANFMSEEMGNLQRNRACLFSKSSLARLQESWNSSICLYEIKRKNLFKSICLTGSFSCAGPSSSGKWWALRNLNPPGNEVTTIRELGQYLGCWCPGSLHRQVISSHGIDYAWFQLLNIKTICNAQDLLKLARSCKQLHSLCSPDLWNLPGAAIRCGFQSSCGALKSTE